MVLSKGSHTVWGSRLPLNVNPLESRGEEELKMRSLGGDTIGCRDWRGGSCGTEVRKKEELTKADVSFHRKWLAGQLSSGGEWIWPGPRKGKKKGFRKGGLRQLKGGGALGGEFDKTEEGNQECSPGDSNEVANA